MKRILCVMSMAMLAWAAPAFSQCGDPNNLMTGDNCGFDMTLGDWTSWDVYGILLDPGTSSHVASGGRTSAGAMSVATADNGSPPFGPGHAFGLWACLPTVVPAGQEIGFGIWANPVSDGGFGPMGAYCEVSIGLSSTSDCLNPISETFDSNFNFTVGTWSKVNDDDVTITSPAGVQGVVLRVLCQGGSVPYTMLFDDAYIGDTMVPVELQTFSVN